MGGHAFKELYCPRISPDVYAEVRLQTTSALRKIFRHVAVPTEMPEKEDYGDIDFLVSGLLHSPINATIDDFDWPGTVQTVRSAFNTVYGHRGFKNPDCMYFALRAPGQENELRVQVDVKLCFDPALFEWQTFELNYASNSKIVGSMVKPLGLTIDPQGLHIRVEEIEETNFPGSMVWVGKDPRDVLRIMGLDRRIVDAGFKTKVEIYQYIAGSCLFNPAHFAARLAEEKYYDRLEDRSPHWTYFIKKWLPEHYPSYKSFEEDPNTDECLESTRNQQNEVLQVWYRCTRTAVREKVFTMFPQVAAAYYTKRATYVEELEEQRLRAMIIDAIPTDDSGWKDDLPQPRIIVREQQADSSTPYIKPIAVGELTPSLTLKKEVFGNQMSLSNLILPSNMPATLSSQPAESWDVPLYVDPLPRTPERPCYPRPPPIGMALDRKIVCLARWTLFDSLNGTPCLLSSPRDKDFEMHWTDATYAGATDAVLINWAKEMWWHAWIRQSHSNYVGLWKGRFEKEDRKAEKEREVERARAKAEEMAKANREKIMGRLRMLNMGLGLIEKDSKVA